MLSNLNFFFASLNERAWIVLPFTAKDRTVCHTEKESLKRTAVSNP